MRKRHNVIPATLFIIGIIFLCAQREANLLIPGGQEHHNGSSRPRVKLGHSTATSLHPKQTGQLGHVIENQQPSLPVHTPESQPEIPVQLPPGGPDPAPQQNQYGLSQFHPEYSFQHDLDLELPVANLKSFSNHAPLYYTPGEPNTNAYATFMSGHNPSIKDPYFLATLSLIHRVLWSPRSRTQKKYPFIAFVANHISQEQRDLLSGAGAIVRELVPLEYKCDKEGFQQRWTDLPTKLNMWSQTDFQKILHLDADAFPLTNVDEMFDLAVQQTCIEENLQPEDYLLDLKPVCEPYVFAGVPSNPDSNSPTYPTLNGGILLFSPSERMHIRFMANYLKLDRYDCTTAEQSFLNWQFSPKGAFPPTLLDREWNAFFPTEDDEGKYKVVHEKLWAQKEDGWMKKEWNRGWIEMTQWFMSDEFAKLRGGGAGPVS